MNFRSWKADQDGALSELQRVALGSAKLEFLALNDRIALGLPRERSLAMAVIGLYRPMKMKACALTCVIKLLTKIRVLRFFARGVRGEKIPELSWLRGLSEIGFLGCNPSHGIRCVLLSKGENESLRVTKLAIGGNLESVLAEAESLQKLSHRYEGLTKLGAVEKGNDWAAFWTEHVAAKGPDSLSSPDVMPLLSAWLRPEKVRLGDLGMVNDKLGWVVWTSDMG